MTGYGESEYNSPNLKINIQIKSLNHRFLDPVFNLPDKLLFLEEKLRNILSKYFSRGRLTIYIDLILPKAQKIVINKILARDYFNKIEDLTKELRLSAKPPMEIILNLPGVIEVLGMKKQFLNEKTTLKILEVFHAACKKLRLSQEKEGRGIFKYLNKNINLINKELVLVKRRIKLATVHKLKSIKIDEEKEAFLRDKDITEEINRIEMHLKNFRRVINKNVPAGKEMDFILQELQRETNTIGAKSFDSFISTQVVIMKTEIEKLREQVQNVE
ncbi:MAG: DUF1732 domain-containing protein [Candidatus Omnitrophota bacterium]